MSARGRSRWLSATQVARHCGVDLKTIHNWVNRGKIPFHRTSGRHLRFWPLDVVDFLRAYEFGVPEALQRTALLVVIVDTDAQALAAMRGALTRGFEVVTHTHVVDGLLAVAALRPDILLAGDVAPLDVPTIATRLREVEATRHVRVVVRADVGEVRETIERIAGIRDG